MQGMEITQEAFDKAAALFGKICWLRATLQVLPNMAQRLAALREIDRLSAERRLLLGVQ